MKKPLLLALVVLGVLTAQAQWLYTDINDGVNYFPANTFNTSTDSPVDWIGTTDGTPLWRFRNTGPGVKAWDTSAYQGHFSNQDPALYTRINGLLPNTAYAVRVYGVYPQNTTNAPLPGSRYGAEFSVDGGSAWSLVDNRGGGTITWVDNSSELGTILPTVSGDTRFFTELPFILISDASGGGRIDIRLPQYLTDGSLQDRFVLDGFALAVPEPSVVALAGLCLAALWTARRRG